MEKKSGPIMQMGFVVEDLDDAIDYWTKNNFARG